MIHIVVLSEFSDAMQHLGNRISGKLKLLTNLTSRFTIDGYIFNILTTMSLAFALRGFLPGPDEIYWISTGACVLLFGRLGSITMAFIRRDLGVKEAGVFIIGRDDLLARLDGLVFISPILFYVITYLNGTL